MEFYMLMQLSNCLRITLTLCITYAKRPVKATSTVANDGLLMLILSLLLQNLSQKVTFLSEVDITVKCTIV